VFRHVARLMLAAWLLAAGLLGAAQAAPASGGDLQPVPPLTDRVIDEAALLTPAQRAAMTSKLAGFEQQTGTQIVVLTVPTTAPEDIASYAQRVGDAWKIGRRDVGDGLLLVVAKNDHTVFIATTKALEGAIPDLAAHHIIDERIVPAFKQGDFAGGLNAGLDALMARVRGEDLPAPPQRTGGARPAAHGGIDIGQLLMFFFIGVPVIGGVLTAILGRKLGSLATAGGAGFLAWLFGAGAVLAGVAGVVALILVGVMGVGSSGRRMGGMPIIWGGGGWGGGGGFGGGGGGGGFSSGGGGDFGGGGASGRW
jgi:uncharacterized protein